MKYTILSLIFISAIAGCNSTANKGSANPDILHPAQDSSAFLLRFFFKNYPKGGTFGGHPAISLYGQIDENILRQDQSVIKSGGSLKVCYTYFENDSFKIVWKELTLGGFSEDK